MAYNAGISFVPTNTDNTSAPVRVFPLYVTKITQDNQLSGIYGQSRKTRHFYPRAHSIGDITFTVIFESQQRYHEFARFLRAHHEEMMGSALQGQAGHTRIGGVTQILSPSNNNAITGYRHLLQLVIPDEDVYVQGWCPRATITKMGVFEPAPVRDFPFVVVFDPLHSTGIELSHQVRDWFNPDPSDITTPAGSSPDFSIFSKYNNFNIN